MAPRTTTLVCPTCGDEVQVRGRIVCGWWQCEVCDEREQAAREVPAAPRLVEPWDEVTRGS